jgi:hypothetical protein
MNTGIADAVDLGWKLAAVFSGWGGQHLLSSYDEERRPIGARNVRMAAEFYGEHEKFGQGVALIDDAGPEGEEVRRRVGQSLVRGVGRMFRTLGLQIGYRYDRSPICLPDGTPPDPDDPDDLIPSARPGSRAPHLWLEDGSSILDLYGRGFVLLRVGLDAPDASAFEMAAASRRVPLQIVVVTEPEAADRYQRRLVLVRSDGHVAWRSDELSIDPATVLDTARGAHGIRA